MSASTEQEPRLDRSMSLLVDMMNNTLDESYVEAARRRAGQDRDSSPSGDLGRTAGARSRLSAIGLLVTLGLVTGIAAAQVREREASLQGVRAELVTDVEQRTRETDALAAQTAALREEVARRQQAGLSVGAAGARAARQLAALELAAGVGAVEGEGVVVRLDDAPGSRDPAAADDKAAASGRVLDRDVQDAVNGLWAAGAEAVSVNDLRLTTLTAIRSAGEAILVDFRPLSPPYVIRAIGSPRLQAGFADGASGRRLSSYTELYGLRFAVERADRLRLPGSGAPRLLHARADGSRS